MLFEKVQDFQCFLTCHSPALAPVLHYPTEMQRSSFKNISGHWAPHTVEALQLGTEELLLTLILPGSPTALPEESWEEAGP